MGWKIRIADIDGKEAFIDTSDIMGKEAMRMSAPMLPRFELDLRGVLSGRREGTSEKDVEKGVWLRIGCYDAEHAPTLQGHEPRRSPQCAQIYDLPLIDGEGLERLAVLEWDGKQKLVRVPAGKSSALVDVSRMEAARSRLVGSSDGSLNEGAYDTFLALLKEQKARTLAEGGGIEAWPGMQEDPLDPNHWQAKDEASEGAWSSMCSRLACEMGWEWSALAPVVAQFDIEAGEAAREAADAGGDEMDIDDDDIEPDGFDEQAAQGFAAADAGDLDHEEDMF